MSDHDTSIDGSLLRLQRETRGWTMTDMAVRSCLSIKQIRQLEEGGSESFYSDAVKLTAAKKVASLLGLSVEQVLGQPARSLPLSSDTSPQPLNLADDTPSEAEARATVTPAEHVLAHPEPELTDAAQAAAQASSDLDNAPQSTHTSLWVMAALFAAALLVAAWMNPSAEPVVPEAEPPLQTLPTEASEPASSVADAASDAVSTTPVASQTRVTGAQAASSATASPAIRASDAAETASR
nr:helix-turn-helix transcriptional regulator [uncultured Limnohabitans sp.]